PRNRRVGGARLPLARLLVAPSPRTHAVLACSRRPRPRAGVRCEGGHGDVPGSMRAVALVVLALTLSAAAYLPGTAPAAASGAASGAAGATEDSARPTRPAGPVRIMLGGDSITHQFSGDYTWRWRLWREFRRQGVPVDFVGVRSYPAPDYNGNVNPPLVPF